MEVKSNYGSTKNSLENDNILTRMQTELKLIVFRVFFLILKDEEQSIAIQIFLQVISFFQYLTFIFHRQLYVVWKNQKVSYQLYKFFGYFMLTPYFEMLNFSSFASMMYALIGIIFMSIMILLLIGYSNVIKINSSYTWPIYILKLIFILFTTILYLPILDLFFQILNCHYDDKDQLKNVVFNNTCWQGSHVIHGVVAILGIVLFVVITMTFNLLYFEPKYNHKDQLSKTSGRAKTFKFFYFLILEISFVLIDLDQFDYVAIYIILIGAFVTFYKLHIEQPFNHVAMQKISSVYAALMLWSALLICFSHYLEDIIFHGTIYAWLIGLPLIAFATSKKEKYLYDLLLMNINKTEDPNQIILLTNYIQKLLSRYQTNQHFHIMLDALIEVHKNTCQKEDCVFRIKKQLNQRLVKLKDENISHRDYQIHLLLGEIYQGYIRRHQNNVRLRINYAFYLLDFLKQKQQALNEFNQIELLSPSLDNEFIIFRYKRIIEDEMNITQNETISGNLDVATELTFQNNMRQFQNKIERATLMHMDFWSQLQEDQPDLGKMNEIGSKINLAIIQVEELWNKMQKMTQNLPKAMRLYAKFIIEVLQDKDFGEELLEKSKILQAQNNKMKNKQTIQVFSSDDINFEPLPTLLVSTSSDKFAQISNLNLSVCNLFGYHKTELINRKINLLIPQVYAKFHDNYMEMFMQSNDQQKLMKERLVYIKLKSGYILPCYLYMKVLQSFDDNILIAAQFRTLRTFKAGCYLILDSDEVIESISSSCICNLFVDQKMISHRKIYFHELFPNYNRNDYLNKTGCVISFNLQSNIVSNSNYLQYYINDLEDQTQILFQIQITEISNEHQDQVMGYVIKLEKVSNEQSQILSPDVQQQLVVPNTHMSNFQFKYFPSKALYIGENQEEGNSARVDQTVIWEQSSRLSEETQAEKKEKVEDVKVEKINYAEGIRTLKLFDNRIQDIEDIRMSFSESDEVQHSSVFQKNSDNPDEIENRKALNSTINDQQRPQVIVYLSWAINILMITVLTLSFTSYFLGLFLFENVQNSLNLINYVSLRNQECSQIVMNVQNLEMLRIGIWNMTESEAIAYEKEQRTELNSSIFSLTDANKKIMLDDLYINEEIEELHSKSVVNVRISKTSFSNYDLIEATQQIISKALLVRDKPLQNLTLDDEDATFITYNLQNGIVFQFRNETNQYSYGIKNLSIQNVEIFFIFMIVSACSFFILLIILVMFIFQINQIQEQILQLFMEIPEKTVKYLYNKSENFISNLQVGEEEEVSSDLSDEEQDEHKELSRTLKSKRKKKIFKNTNSFHRSQIIIITFILVVFQGYFLLNYFLNQVTYNNLKQQIPELNVTARCSSFYRFVDNCERQLFLNPNEPILLENAYQVVMDNIQQNYDIDSDLHQEHAKNSEIQNSNYYDTFQSIFMLNPCDTFVQYGYTTIEYCESFANGSIQQGMAVAIARYFENVRYIMTIYDMFNGHPEVNFSVAARGWGRFRNITNDSDNVTNYIYNLNNFKQTSESRIMQNVFIKAAFRYLLDEFLTALKYDIEVTQTQLLAVFIVFEVLIFFVYFIVWLPAQMKMTRDIWRTKGLIMMIPLRVIQKIKTIKDFIGILVHSQDK
ncbi:unnamed protein product [Paramecium octaurelia]|uniref:PAS domain-containing protein n=1 Tax=Paramecium octaurelia TaxID=43137 RepID=A0A8S1YGB3_PAROT|nr:unnamed protein product [Paramecium octaurelia]